MVRNRSLGFALATAILALASCGKQQAVTGLEFSERGDAQNSQIERGERIDQEHGTGPGAYALGAQNSLIRIDLTDPKRILGRIDLTGLGSGVRLLGIDFRPATGGLYGLGSDSRLYQIDVDSGAATAVSATPFTPALSGTAFGFDFNPTVDRIRVVSNTGQNLRLHPVTGAVAAMDANLAYAGSDPNGGSIPRVTGAAYTNPDNDPMTATTLYDIDAALGVLVTQNPPNNGTLNTVGALNLDVGDLLGFDIRLDGTSNLAYLAVTQRSRGAQAVRLMRVDLATGAATDLGRIGRGESVTGLAIPTQ